MKLANKQVLADGRRVSLTAGCGEEIGHAYLYLLRNELHSEPFGFVEDVHIDEHYRGQNLGQQLMDEVIGLARELGCYKLILTSRHGREKLHQWYERMGFVAHGGEFRLNLTAPSDTLPTS